MKLHLTITLILFVNISSFLFATEKAVISVEPTVTKSIKGISELDRTKYFNISNPGTDFESKIGNAEQVNYYLNDLDMTFGRDLGGVSSERQWGNSIIQDRNRPGYIDMNRFIQVNASDIKITCSNNFLRAWRLRQR